MEGPEGLLQGSDRGEQLVERKRLPQEALPRNRPNTRVKDLPDLALLATAQAIDAKRLRAALEQTFTYRKTHALPPSVPAPLEAWTTPYQALARDEQLSWATLDEVLAATHTFLDPVLAGALDATWDLALWSWRLHRLCPSIPSAPRKLGA
jgi:hypothetical protein